MRKLWIVGTIIVLSVINSIAQVAEMNWELDYEIYLKMANDSNYTYDIREVFHVTDTRQTDFTSEFIFYPVNPGEVYASSLGEADDETNYSTLWSALNAKLGGGWVHFINCIAYAMETQSLNLQEAIMKRPDTDWKPDPVTESWTRTRKWEYYIPLTQKLAQTEYKYKVKEGSEGDLKNLPQAYIDLFVNTNDKVYQSMKGARQVNQLAKIDLVKVIIGANYLGEEQINYLSNAVLNAVKTYAQKKLPSVLIFDEFEAAAAMSLNAEGYQLENIVFKASANLSDDTVEQRKAEIRNIIETINEYNRVSFQKRLSTYYKE